MNTKVTCPKLRDPTCLEDQGQKLGFGVLGFGFRGLGFRGLGFRCLGV